MSNEDDNPIDPTSLAGVAAGVAQGADQYTDNVRFHNPRGFGFAAENANNMVDVARGERARVVGGDNAKHGPDRVVGGVSIQSKYCRTGSECIAQCFEDGRLKYVNTDGTPMAIEVPSDKYESAVQAMEARITKGQVPGVTDPSEARNIVRKGHFTYEQVRNIARAGTIESLSYDAARGVITAGSAFSVSAVITFALALWRVEDLKTALKQGGLTGLKVGGVAWLSSVLAAQVGRTGIETALRPVTDLAVKSLGHKGTHFVVNGLRSGKPIYGSAASSHLSKLLRGNVVTGIITTGVLSTVDLTRVIRGRISGGQALKNIAATAGGVAGGTGGWMGGAAAGAALGSAFPGPGTVIGGIVGGVVGALGGGTLGQAFTRGAVGLVIEDDAKSLLATLEAAFIDLAVAYLLSEQEINEVSETLTEQIKPKKLRDMYASGDREGFSLAWLEPIVRKVIEKRQKVLSPSAAELQSATESLLNELLEEQRAAGWAEAGPSS